MEAQETSLFSYDVSSVIISGNFSLVFKAPFKSINKKGKTYVLTSGRFGMNSFSY